MLLAEWFSEKLRDRMKGVKHLWAPNRTERLEGSLGAVMDTGSARREPGGGAVAAAAAAATGATAAGAAAVAASAAAASAAVEV